MHEELPFRTVVLASTFAIGAAVALAAWPENRGQAQTVGRAASGLLMGVVLDEAGRQPVAGAQVTLGGAVANLALTQVLTDAEGRFVFLDLPRGTYTLTVTKAGYADGALGRRRPEGPTQTVTLAEAERVGDLRIPIWKFAAITGAVRDESGEPMVALPVRVLRRTVVAGRRKLTPGATVRTDDRGIYRFGSLVPGDYLVAVPSTQAVAPESVVDLYRARLTGVPPSGQPDLIRDLAFSGGADVPNLISRNGAPSTGGLAHLSLSGSMRAAAPATGADGRLFVYPTQFHFGALAPAQAATITVGSGEERIGVDLQLRLVPGSRVSGAVRGPNGPLLAVLTLTPDTDDYSTDASIETATTLSDASGRFTFIGVPPGQYRLRATRVEVPATGTGSRGGAPPPGTRAPGGAAPAPLPALGGYTLSAIQPLSVGTTDMDGIVVTVHAGHRVSGRAEFPNATTPVDPALIRRMSVTFDPADGRPLVSTTIGRGQFDEHGQLSTYQMPPGRYYLRLNGTPPGWTLKHAMWSGQDISNTPLTLDRDASGVTIVLTDRPSSLSGEVRDASGAPDATATVLIFPADTGGWTDYGDVPRRLRAVRAGRDGRYEAVALPAGDYLVVAVVDESATNWQDPVTLKSLARVATPVTLGDDDSRTLALRTMTVAR